MGYNNILNEADSLIRTLQSLNNLDGHIDYDPDQKTFQNVQLGISASLGLYRVMGWSTEVSGNHQTLQKGLDELKERIIQLTKGVETAEPYELKLLLKKIEDISSLYLVTNKTLLSKILPSYKQAGVEDQKTIALELSINELAKTFMKTQATINKIMSSPGFRPPSDLPPNPPWFNDPANQSNHGESEELPPPSDLPPNPPWLLDKTDPNFKSLEEVQKDQLPLADRIYNVATNSEKESIFQNEMPANQQIKEGNESEISIKSSKQPEKLAERKVTVTNLNTSYQFPISDAEKKLIESENEAKSGKPMGMLAGRNLISLKGILTDYEQKFEEFQENYKIYQEVKEKEVAAAKEFQKFIPIKNSGLRGGGSPIGGVKRGGPAPLVKKNEPEKDQISEVQKNQSFSQLQTSKTKRMESEAKLLELLFPGKSKESLKDFDFDKLDDFYNAYTIPLADKIIEYNKEIESLKTKKAEPEVKIQSPEAIKQAKIDSLNKKIKNLESNLKTYENAIKRHVNDQKTLSTQLDKKQIEFATTDDPNKISKIGGEIKILATKLAEIPKEIKRKEELIIKNQNDLEKVRQELEKM